MMIKYIIILYDKSSVTTYNTMKKINIYVDNYYHIKSYNIDINSLQCMHIFIRFYTFYTWILHKKRWILLIFLVHNWSNGKLTYNWYLFIDKYISNSYTICYASIIGLGNCQKYAITFVNSMSIIYDRLWRYGIKIIGITWDTSFKYNVVKYSRSILYRYWWYIFFCGLALDVKNYPIKSYLKLWWWLIILWLSITYNLLWKK